MLRALLVPICLFEARATQPLELVPALTLPLTLRDDPLHLSDPRAFPACFPVASLRLRGRPLYEDGLVDVRGAGTLSAEGDRVVSLKAGEIVVTALLESVEDMLARVSGDGNMLALGDTGRQAVLRVPVVRRLAVSARLLCRRRRCEPPDPEGWSGDWGFEVMLTLVSGRAVYLTQAPDMLFVASDERRFSRAEQVRPLVAGRVRVEALFDPGAWGELHVEGARFDVPLAARVTWPPGSVGAQLRRVHCSPRFQSLRVRAFLGAVDVSQDASVRLSGEGCSARVVPGTRDEVEGLSPGRCELAVLWRGYVSPPGVWFDVVGESVPLVGLQLGRHDLVGPAGSVHAIRAVPSFLMPDNLTVWSPDAWPLLFAVLAEVVATGGPEVELDRERGELVIRGNSLEEGQLVLRGLPGCGSSSSWRAALTANLAFEGPDVDVGAEFGVPVTWRAASRVPVRLLLPSRQPFVAELALSAEVAGCERGEGVVGAFGCTLNDPPGVVRLAGSTGQGVVAYLDLLPLAAGDAASLTGWIKVPGGRHPVMAGSFDSAGGLTGSFDSAGAAEVKGGQRRLLLSADGGGSLGVGELNQFLVGVATRKLRFARTYVFGTDMELSVMVRVTDWDGLPDSTKSAVVVFCSGEGLGALALHPALAGSPRAGEFAFNASLVGDGWYAVQWVEQVPDLANLTVETQVQTWDAAGATSPDRVWRGYPTNQTVGLLTHECPYVAQAPGVLQATLFFHSKAQAYVNSTAVPHLARALACLSDTPPERLSLLPDASGLLTVTVSVESFRRAQTVYAALTDEAALRDTCAEYGFPLDWVERGDTTTLEPPLAPTTREARLPCLNASHYYDHARWLPLPAHAEAGGDCFGFECDPAFQLQEEAGECLPVLVDAVVFWAVMLVITVLVAAVLITACFARAGAVRRKPPLEVLDPMLLPVDAQEVSGGFVFVCEVTREPPCELPPEAGGWEDTDEDDRSDARDEDDRSEARDEDDRSEARDEDDRSEAIDLSENLSEDESESSSSEAEESELDIIRAAAF